MGIVYRANQVALNRPVALKLLSPVYAADEAFRERFKREWETAAAIDHPNVIPLYEAGEAQGHLFLAMRYVSGVDLANLIAREEIAPDRALRLLAQAASALDAAHARDLVHRDVKPANMLVDPGDHVYLTDFGLSRGTAQSRLTRTGLFVGSTDYAAPEQIRGEPPSPSWDIWALSVMAFEAAVGIRPIACVSLALAEHPPASDERWSGPAVQRLTPALGRVFGEALSLDPALRPKTASAFFAELQRALD
jgi:serine/threonine protein kinase